MIVKIILAASFLMIASDVYCAEKSENSAQPIVTAIIAKLEASEIGQVEIVQIPARIFTRTNLTPEMLEAGFYYKLTIHDMRGGTYVKDMLKLTKSLVVQPQEEMPDLRWGVIFYDTNGRRLGAFFFSPTGSRGAVNSIPVSLNGDFLKWLNTNFSSPFR